MIDCENEVYTRIVRMLREEFPGINVAGEYTKTPSSFPHVSITQSDNSTIADKQDTSGKEAMSLVMFAVCREYEKIDFQTAHAWNHELRNRISWGLRMTVCSQKFDEAREFDDLMFRSLLFGAQHFFDDYLQAVEYGKPLDKKFYQPRRHYLRRYVDAYQEILDGKLDFLSISMPKRAGKSQLGINFTNMLSGKYPDRATLMEGTGDDLVKSFYLGCLEYLTLPSDYHFYDIFPESKLVQTNADTKIINLLHKSRFPTVMCRSIDARQVGLSEATNLLYLDDCVEGREEAKNRQRLDDKWEVISGDIIGRAIEGTPIVICGTRYSLYDPIGHLQEEMQKQGKRCKIIETPALDLVTDESNFEYMREGRKVFTTQYFRDQREMLSEEQFESEFQQKPFEAKGILFPEKSLNRYFELPIDRDPDSIIAVYTLDPRNTFVVYNNGLGNKPNKPTKILFPCMTLKMHQLRLVLMKLRLMVVHLQSQSLVTTLAQSP